MENKEVKNIGILNSKKITFFLLISFLPLIVLISCAQAKSGYHKTTSKISQLSQKFVRSIRDPGDHLILSEQKTNLNYVCSKYKPYRLFIESLEIVPSVVNKGEEFNQRVQFAFCSNKNKTVDGTMKRVLKYEGNVIFSDSESYKYRPGTWAVDVFIEVPPDAGRGKYQFEITLKYGYKTAFKNESFIVQ
jgi:hypothetical protein